MRTSLPQWMYSPGSHPVFAAARNVPVGVPQIWQDIYHSIFGLVPLAPELVHVVHSVPDTGRTGGSR